MDLENPDWIRPQIGKESESVQERQNAFVGWPAGQLTPVRGRPVWSTGTNREQLPFSRSTASVDRLLSMVDRAVV